MAMYMIDQIFRNIGVNQQISLNNYYLNKQN